MSSCATCGKSDVTLKKCARCQNVAYCSTECQRTDWPSHKAQCSNTGAAAAAPSSSSPNPTVASIAAAASAPGGFRFKPSANQMSDDPEMADLQRQLLQRIMSEQMTAAGGAEAAKKDPEGFKKMMQQRVAEQLKQQGIQPNQLAEKMKSTSGASSSSSSSAAADGVRRRGAPQNNKPLPKNPFTGEVMQSKLGKHEMPFGMPGTYYGPDDDEDGEDGEHGQDAAGGHSHNGVPCTYNHDAQQHGGHNHSHGGDEHAGHNHSHGDHSGHNHGDHAGHNHSHGGDDHAGHNHSHGGEDGHNHAGHNHSHGGEDGHNHAGHNHSHGGDNDAAEHNHGGHNHSHGDHAGHNHSHGGDGEEHGEHNHGEHNHGGHNHTGAGHNHSHGGDDDHAGHNHSHGDGTEHAGHNHSHGGADEAEHNHGGHNHSHGGAGHNHSHGGEDGDDAAGHNHSHGDAAGHNHSHDGGAGHDHNHGGRAAGRKHNHGGAAGGDHSGHNHGPTGAPGGGAGGRDGSAPIPDTQRFGNKLANGARGAGKVETEDSTAAKEAHVYTQPSLQVLQDNVEEGLKEIATHVTVGPVSVETKAKEAFQLLYSSSAVKRPALPGLLIPSSLTYLPLSSSSNLDLSGDDLAERTGECHLCILANQPFSAKGQQPSKEDMELKQALWVNHVRVGKGLEQAFENKEITPTNPPLSGAPADVNQESLAPDCSIEMHSFQVRMKYENPLDKMYGTNNVGSESSAAASAASNTSATVTELDPTRITALQSTFGLGPSKSTLKKAKAKAKAKALAAAQAAEKEKAAASGGFLSSLTSMFTGGSSTTAAPVESESKEDDDEDDEENNNSTASATASTTETDSTKEKKLGTKRSRSSPDGLTQMTVVQVLVRCAPPCTTGEGFAAALNDRDPIKMYRFEFVSPTPQTNTANQPSQTAGATPASSASPSTVVTPLLAAYQHALDFVICYLHRQHPVPQPTSAQRANFTVKDAQGNLRPAAMPSRMFPSHLALWIDRPEWTGIPKTPFVAKKLPQQSASDETLNQSIVPKHTHDKLNPNLYFTPKEKTLDYNTSKTLALAEQNVSTQLLASLWKSYNLKELNLHVFPQGHALYLYKSFLHIEKEVAARRAYYQKGKYRPKKLFQNERLDIQLQFEPTPEEIAVIEAERERRKAGLPPLEAMPEKAKVELEEDVDQAQEEEMDVGVKRFLVL